MAGSFTKIAIVFNSLDVGGIETKIVDLCRHFSSQPQYQIFLLLKHYRGSFLPLIPDNVSIITPHTTDTAKLRTLLFPLWLSRQFIHLDPDIILSFGNFSSICSVLGKLASGSKSKLIISEDSSITTQLKAEHFSLLRKILLKLTYPLATKIIVLSEAGKQKLQKYIPNCDRIVILPNWVSPRFTQMLPSKFPPKDIDVLFLGRFEDQKNPLRFVKIIKLLSKKYPNLNCQMVGDGSLKPETQKKVQRLGLDLVINILPSTIYPSSILLRSKLLLLTSNHEGFPLTLLEAGASQCLPVMSSLPETDDYFSGHRQYLIYQSDREAAEKILRLLSQQDLYHEISHYYAKLTRKHQRTNLLKLSNLLIQK